MRSIERLRSTAGSLALLFALCMPNALVAQGASGSSVARPTRAKASGSVHTDTLWAQSLGITKALTVYLPPSYHKSPSRRYPVLVYLHGLTGNERNWVEQGALGRTLDSLSAAGKPEAIVVMPDGDDGWYSTWNQLVDASVCRSDTTRREPAATYCVPWPHYDDYIANDIVSHVDRQYRTRPGPASRGIAGLSMGGYGAVTLALSYPHVFGAAASHSGVLSPRVIGPQPFATPARYASSAEELRLSTGSRYRWLLPVFGRDTIGWVARDPGRMAARLKRKHVAVPALLIDCGIDDPYIDQNRDLHSTLQKLGIAHRYKEWPGTHDWAYWRAHSPESLAFLLERVSHR
ncbi:MAG: alpha/beta hydrolase family protein [Gemmatimonas sp.]